MRKYVANAGIAVLTLLVCVVVAEIALRLFWENPHRNSSADEVVPIRMQHPLVDLPVDRTRISEDLPDGRLRTDERSYILPSFQYDDPDFTVAFLGGSTTACAAVSEKLRFHGLVDTYLSNDFRINTLNAARSGNTSHDSINALLNHVILDHPDVAVMMHAANDASLVTFAGGYQSRMGRHVNSKMILRWTAQLLSRFSLVSLLREAVRVMMPEPKDEWTRTPREDADGDPREITPEDRIVNSRYDEFRNRLEAFIGISEAMGIVPVIMTQPASPAYRNALTPAWVNSTFQEAFNDIVRAVGRERSVLVIDLAGHIRNNVEGWDQPDVVFYDALHINDKGSQVYARHIAEKLLPVLRQLEAERRPQVIPAEG